MQYRTREQLSSVAAIHPSADRAMTRDERLERWAEVLERRGGTVRALRGIEFVPRPELRATREDGSALSVAFGDPVLRASGLRSDRYEDAVAFFELREHEAHLILCNCYRGETPSAKEVAGRVRCATKSRCDVGLSLAMPMLVSVAAAVAALLAAAL
jgi:hypothetical protein